MTDDLPTPPLPDDDRQDPRAGVGEGVQPVALLVDGAEAAGQLGVLVLVDLLEHDLDAAHVGHPGERLVDAARDVVTPGVPEDRHADRDRDPLAVDVDGVHEPQVDDGPVQLGVVDGAQGLEDLVVRRRHRLPGQGRPGLAGRPADFHYADRYNTGRAPANPAGHDRDLGRRARPLRARPSAPELDADRFAGYISAVTNAFGDPTRREIYLYARGPGEGVTAADVARRFQLHPNVARHHLDKLAAGGYLDVALTRVRDGRPPVQALPGRGPPAGRPGAPRLHTRHDDLVANLLVRTIERLDPDEAAGLAEIVGYEYGLSLAARMAPTEGQRSVKAALAAVADALTAHGFAARTGTPAEGLAIVAEACPFGVSAQRFPHVMCAIDRGLVRGLLSGLYGETHPEQAETRPSGATHCVTRV